jgi:hypothetical protein
MSFDNQNEGKAFLRIVFTTVFILTFMTGLNFLFIFNSMGANPFAPIERTIASIPEIKTNTKEKITTPVIEVNCQVPVDNLAINTKSYSVRIVFKNCPTVTSLINQSNNNESDLFPVDKNSWTTDFIVLKSGQNSLLAQWEKSKQMIEIYREKLK